MSIPKPLSSFMPALTRETLGKRGMLFGKLLEQWGDIAGAELAKKATPVELKFAGKADKGRNQATLFLAASSSAAVELQYELPIIIEKLNIFFGYTAIKDIKIIHKKTSPRLKKSKTVVQKAITPAKEKAIEDITAKIAESDLQQALKSLGKAVMKRQDIP